MKPSKDLKDNYEEKTDQLDGGVGNNIFDLICAGGDHISGGISGI